MGSNPLRISAFAARFLTVAIAFVFLVTMAVGQAQVSTADLTGTVVDPSGAVVSGATVRARSTTTGLTRTVAANASGEFSLIGLQPGDYEITVEAPSFKKAVISPVKLTVGQSASIEVKLELGEQTTTVTISGDQVELVETGRTSIANTIEQQRIENLPINERSATGFALTLSTVGRDNGRPIGPAPTSGLNIGGQRGRSTQVNVDGADFTDNSVNASRSTVSQEAVQEYQISTNSYTAEFGRATGGVVNVVTKRGTNEYSGNVFGFIRDKSIQARNAFAPVAKPDFRRTQWGMTFGGPIIKDKIHFFTAFERRQRDESGFFTSDVIGNLTSSATIQQIILAIPGGGTLTVNPAARSFDRLTAQQAAFINGTIAQGLVLVQTPATFQQGVAALCAARAYAFFATSGGQTALTGSNSLISPNDGSSCPAISPILPSAIGSRFLLSGTPVPVGTVNAAGEGIAFRPLTQLRRIFPVTERTNYWSMRGDYNVNDRHQFSMRIGYNPSTITGIQVESQNQSLGQNDFSRTGITTIKDVSFGASLNSALSETTSNELRFAFGRRSTTFRSQNGDAVAFNISGTAFIGRELFSPVDRRENRFQIVDNFSWVVGNHTIKFGGDANYVEIPDARFELNFAGLFNFGDFAASNLGFPAAAPAFTPVQSYGLGLPSLFVQGFGDPISRLKNKPFAFFIQDSWKATSRLTLNYGIRYDVELTQQIAPVAFRDPLSGISLSANDILAAQDAVGVQQGFPRDTNNFAPRFGFAYDLFGNGKTVVRGSIGLYYDHPLLVVGFNSDIADAAQQQQAVLTAGSPAPTALLNAAQVFQGTVCGVNGSVPTICGATVTPGAASSAQYQFGRQRFNDQTFPGFGAVLPFTLPVSKDFEYAYATQANLSLERQLTKDMALSASYIFVGAKHLPHPTDLNTPNTSLQIENFRRFAGRDPFSTQEAIAFSLPTTVCPVAPTGVTAQNCVRPSNGTQILPGQAILPGDLFPNYLFARPVGQAAPLYALIVPGLLTAPSTSLGTRIIAPAAANFFRPNAPNYFLIQSLTGLTKAQFDPLLAGSLRSPGVISPFGSVNAQISDGNASYNAMNVELKKRFSNNFTFLASYTWSHSIDDSSDLQTLLIAQDVRRFNLEKADSLFDQRHRFVFSGLVSSPDSWRSGSGWQKFFSDFTIAPIVELSSGRPFNIITNVDANNDQSTQTDRPSVNTDGTLCVPGAPGCATGLITNGEFSIGNLGRNMGLTRGFASVDLRIARAIRFGERFRIDLIAEGFNLFNRFNEGSASPFITDVNLTNQRAGNGRFRSRSTAAYDPRQFQFGAKFSF